MSNSTFLELALTGLFVVAGITLTLALAGIVAVARQRRTATPVVVTVAGPAADTVRRAA